VDRYPLMKPINISSQPPTSTSSPTPTPTPPPKRSSLFFVYLIPISLVPPLVYLLVKRNRVHRLEEEIKPPKPQIDKLEDLTREAAQKSIINESEVNGLLLLKRDDRLEAEDILEAMLRIQSAEMPERAKEKIMKELRNKLRSLMYT